MSEHHRTIVADPPWPYADAGRNANRALVGSLKKNGEVSRQVATEYPPMSLAELAALQPQAAENAHLYLWTTNAFMVEAHRLAGEWGFKPKTILTWVKTQPDGSVSRKTGYYFRGATEHIVFAVRGSLPLQTAEALPTAFLWPRAGGHSAKPDAFYDLVEQASPGPYAELFARRARFGWDYPVGDQVLGGATAPVKP